MDKQEKSIIGLLLSLLAVGIYVIFHTHNTFGGADNISHYFAAHYGWQYPRLLFDHWSKPVFTILSSPFAQFGINGVRVYNLILGLSSAFLVYKTARIFELKSAFISVILTLLAPIYFILMFTSLTEISFSFFLILGVYLFFSEKLHWSAIVFSFLPIIRTEGIIFLPLFVLAFALRKSYLSIILLSFGFFLISIAGYHFYDSFFWLITKMPYGGSSVYGSGPWYHFLAQTRYITGFLIAILFIVSLVLVFKDYIKDGVFKFGKSFFILLMVFAPFVLFVAAHSTAWAMGTGGSLGLIRVIGSVIPLATLAAVFSFEKIYNYLINKNRYLIYGLFLLISIFMFHQTYHIYRWGFFPSTREKLLEQTADYLKNNNLDKNDLVYYDTYLIYALGRDPYDRSNTVWMISNREMPSMSFDYNTIIVWDSHFGNNEGRMPLRNLLNDPNLVLLKKIVPKEPFKVLGGYDYEIDIFQKGSVDDIGLMRNYQLTYNNYERIPGEDSICLNLTPETEYAAGVEVKTALLCNKYTNFDIKVAFDIKNKSEKDIKDLLLVLTIESGNGLIYKPENIDTLFDNSGAWKTVQFEYHNIGISSGVEILKVYLWNKGKNHVLIDNFNIDFEEVKR